MAGASRDQTQAIPFANFGTGSSSSGSDVPVARGSPLGLDALSQFMHQRFSWFPSAGPVRHGLVFRMNSALLHFGQPFPLLMRFPSS